MVRDPFVKHRKGENKHDGSCGDFEDGDTFQVLVMATASSGTEKKNQGQVPYFPWNPGCFDRDPYSGSLKSQYDWVGFHPLELPSVEA